MLKGALLFLLLAVPLHAQDFPAFGENGVIIPAERMRGTPFPLYGEFREANDYWTPDADTIQEAEARVLKYLKARKLATGEKLWINAYLDEMIASVKAARRQYIGLMVGERHVLHTVYLPESVEAPEWRRQACKFHDGPVGSWSIEYAPTAAALESGVPEEFAGTDLMKAPFNNLYFQRPKFSHTGKPGQRYGVIFPLEYGREQHPISIGEKIDAYWTPDTQSIQEMESKILTFLHGQLASQKNDYPIRQLTQMIRDIDLGFRQYVGYQKGGQNFILINRTPSSYASKGKWEQEFSVTFDGGANYWMIQYDIEKAEFFDLAINGEA